MSAEKDGVVSERMLIGAMAASPELRELIGDQLTPDMFSSSIRSRLFLLVQEVPPTDAVLFESTLKLAFGDKYAEAGDEWSSAFGSRGWHLHDDVQLEHHVTKVRDLHALRCLSKLTARITLESNAGVINPAEFIQTAGSDVQRLVSSFQAPSSRPETEREVGEWLWIDFTPQKGSQAPESVVSTGIQELDRMLTGLRAGNKYVIAGRPGMGKSAFAHQLANELAIHGRVLSFSYEMEPAELMARRLANLTGIDSKLIERRALNDLQKAKLRNAIDTLGDTMVYVDNRSSRIEDLCARARLEYRKNGNKLGGIVVDYVQRMDTRERGLSPEQRTSLFSRRLADLGSELKCPMLIVSQLNREVDKRDDKRPLLSDLRESGAIEQDANCVLMLYRAAYYRAPNADPNAVEVIIAKQRGGETGIIEMRFDPTTSWFGGRFAANKRGVGNVLSVVRSSYGGDEA